MLTPGDKVRDYEVIAPLGSGGMAMLYLARRRGVGGFSRLVTLKLVHQHLSDDQNIIGRFLEEARIAAHVVHPNVVHVEELGRCAGGYFIAMEYVHGVSLAELLTRMAERRLRLRPKLCVWIAAQIAEALHAAHAAKAESGAPLEIVHRDVSPQNVLIAHTGHVKLIDFGIAKSQTQPRHGSNASSVLGKLRYVSPEQLQSGSADCRSDVYALGVVLWEMLCGRNFLRCRSIDDECDWRTRQQPPPPSQHAAQVTGQLDQVVQKALACDPSARYEGALALRTELLRADPSALQIDAPRVAGLMHSILGEELERRRASWPSEVAEQLEVAADAITAQPGNLAELTSEIVAASPGPDEGDRPSHTSQRALPPVLLVPHEPALQRHTRRALAIVAGGLALGSFLGTWLSHTPATAPPPTAATPARPANAPTEAERALATRSNAKLLATTFVPNPREQGTATERAAPSLDAGPRWTRPPRAPAVRRDEARSSARRTVASRTKTASKLAANSGKSKAKIKAVTSRKPKQRAR